MKYLLLLLILPTLVWGSKILSYNVYDRNDRVDVMLTFDTPYEGVLRQSRQGDTIIVKLEEASIEAPKTKEINSRFLRKLTITPQSEQLELVAQITPNVTMQASKTSDSYGLRLRFLQTGSVAENVKTLPVDETSLSGLPTKNGNEFEQSYYVVIAILVIGIAILFWLKHSIAKKTGEIQSRPNNSPWLFKTPAPEPVATVQTASPLPASDGGNGVNVRFQKSLDTVNSVAMLDYGNQSYLVLLGPNPLLLDKFHDNVPVSQSEFEHMLQNKHRELDSFFQITSGSDEPFDTYKEKASGAF